MWLAMTLPCHHWVPHAEGQMCPHTHGTHHGAIFDSQKLPQPHHPPTTHCPVPALDEQLAGCPCPQGPHRNMLQLGTVHLRPAAVTRVTASAALRARCRPWLPRVRRSWGQPRAGSPCPGYSLVLGVKEGWREAPWAAGGGMLGGEERACVFTSAGESGMAAVSALSAGRGHGE